MILPHDNKSWSSMTYSTRFCPRSVIASVINKWSAKLVSIIQVDTFADDSTLSTSIAEENALKFWKISKSVLGYYLN